MNALAHDTAVAMATHLLDLLRVPKRQRRPVFEALYRVCVAGIETYETFRTPPPAPCRTDS